MEGKEWNREDPECQEAIRKRKRNRAAKAAWVSSKKAGKAIVKALWWSIDTMKALERRGIVKIEFAVGEKRSDYMAKLKK